MIYYGREGFYEEYEGCGQFAEGLVGHVGDCKIYYVSSKGLYSPSPGCEWVEKAAKTRRLSKKHDPASAKALDSVSGRLQPHDNSSPADGSTDFVSKNPLDEQSHGVHTLSTVFDNGPYADYNSYSRRQILRRAQRKLREAGLYHSGIDGAMGPGTQTAIIAWQEKENIPVTGLLDHQTLRSLYLLGLAEQAPPRKRVYQGEQVRQYPPPSPTPDAAEIINRALGLIPH